MQLQGQELLASKPTSLKFIFNDDAAAFSPATGQHKDIAGLGLQYRDEGGNAQAGLITNGHVEIRGHQHLRFSTERVLRVWKEILKETKSDYLAALPLHYQGRLVYTPAPRSLQ